jgi:hypothetical protein
MLIGKDNTMSDIPSSTAPQVTSAPAETIQKPSTFDLSKFKSKKVDTIAGVRTLLPPLPHMKIADAKDWVRTHPREEHWADELCFVDVPIVGQEKSAKHLIEEALAMQYLPSGRIIRTGLVLAARPYNKFFLCFFPTSNLDNVWNSTNLRACIEAKQYWVQATSRGKENGAEGYKIDYAEDQGAFPDPEWPAQSLDELIMTAFTGHIIDNAEHPALLRLRGASQKL